MADLAGTVLSFFCSIRLQWVPGHSFLPGNDAADELARRGALLAPSAIPCSLSPLVSDWRRTVSSKYFDTQVPSISTEELVLPRHARCVLSRLRYNEHSLRLGSYFSRIGRIENRSCSACGHFSSHSALSSCGLFAPLTLWRLSVSTTSGPDPGELPGFWGSMVFRHAPIPRSTPPTYLRAHDDVNILVVGQSGAKSIFVEVVFHETRFHNAAGSLSSAVVPNLYYGLHP